MKPSSPRPAPPSNFALWAQLIAKGCTPQAAAAHVRNLSSSRMRQ